MVKRVNQRIMDEYPDYLELRYLAQIAAQSWPKFGISLADLTGMELWQVEMVKLLLC